MVKRLRTAQRAQQDAADNAVAEKGATLSSARDQEEVCGS